MHVLFYRLGDFYEMFFDDAIVVSKELELTLTGKSCGCRGTRADVRCSLSCSGDGYLNKLVAARSIKLRSVSRWRIQNLQKVL